MGEGIVCMCSFHMCFKNIIAHELLIFCEGGVHLTLCGYSSGRKKVPVLFVFNTIQQWLENATKMVLLKETPSQTPKLKC